MSRRHTIMLLSLAAIWGSSFMFIKVAVREVEPSFLVAARLILAALTLAVVVPLRLSLREAARQLRPTFGWLVVLGVVNAAIPFWLLAWGETRIDSNLAALVQAATPLFTALLAFFFVRSQHAGGLQLLGVAVGFGGVALLVGGTPGGEPLGALAVVAMSFCYSVGALLAVRRFPGVSPLAIAVGSTTVAAIVSLPAAVVEAPDHVPGWKATASILVLGVAGLGIAYILYFVLIAGAGATRGVLVTYLVPPIALAYGAVFLDEKITATAIGGLVLILGGVALGSGVMRFRRRAALPAPP